MSVFLEVDEDEWIARNAHAFAIRDSFPVSPGHSLVVPHRVIGQWWDATDDEKSSLLALVDVVKRRLDVEFAPDGYNVGFNNGEAAGQTVAHLHIHVIPRYDGDVEDPRGGIRHVIPGKGNYFAATSNSAGGGFTTRAATPLITPINGALKLELMRCLIREDLDHIDLVVSFIMRSGIDLVASHVDDALARGATIRILTTDYLGITDISALGFFLDRVGTHGEGSLSVSVFSDPSTSFHPKAYLFRSTSNGTGVAIVGSSNLSRSGITRGIEWNIRTRDVAILSEEFERLWNDSRSVPLTAQWLADYAVRRPIRSFPTSSDARGSADATDQDADAPPDFDVFEALADNESEAPPEPWSVQGEALAALEASRVDGHTAGLVVMATGLGKTWLAAFDSTRPSFRRVLFIAHREEILKQARDTFRRVRPTGLLALFAGASKSTEGDVVFASVQSLHGHLGEFDPDAFDYVVVDEFHHAAANTYRKVLAHFRPRFMLGLTATPDRADAADLLALCSDNLVYDCGLVEGVSRGLLSPFVYRAIPDVAEYAEIPWRSGRFDAEALTAELATNDRAAQVYEQWRSLGGADRRTIGFCCTIAHAEFMAEAFRIAGVRAVAVHSASTSAPRAESLDRLAEGLLDVIFTVDLFNEGMDLPALDLVLMLRPTESPVVFMQQLGRGLRRYDNKNHLDVVDLVGNHRSFLLKARILAQLAGQPNLSNHEAVAFLNDRRIELGENSPQLPPGCSIIVDPRVIDFLTQLAGPVREVDRLTELARQWVDDHQGQRPSALEMSIAYGKPFSLKNLGGWFGFLERLGLLNDREQRALRVAHEFLLWIEHGSYTKSYKLVTLDALIRSGRLRSGMSVSELAAMCRWEILREPALRMDLADTAATFADPNNPAPDEWLRYWKKNPINAITTATRGSQPWFALSGDSIRFTASIGDTDGEEFDALVSEIVAYRLHRYLTQQQARRVGEQRQFQRDGEAIDATFTVEYTDHRPTSVVIECSGGTKGSAHARNHDYVDGIDLLLERLRDLAVPILDIYVDTARTQDLAIADRRLDPAGHGFPVDLGHAGDLTEMRKALLRSMARVGQLPESTGGGNNRKRTRFIVAVDDTWTPTTFADALATGSFAPGLPHSVRAAQGPTPTGAHAS